MVIEIVDFPIENGGSFHSYVTVYQRVGHTIEIPVAVSCHDIIRQPILCEFSSSSPVACDAGAAMAALWPGPLPRAQARTAWLLASFALDAGTGDVPNTGQHWATNLKSMIFGSIILVYLKSL